MLKNTFCHIPGIGKRREHHLWASGLLSWEAFAECGKKDTPEMERLSVHIEESIRNLETGNAGYFSGLLPSGLLWRIFPEFRHSTAYIDIETTGLSGPGDYITTISLYDGRLVRTYVNGHNLEDFKDDIQRYRVIVTYNGRCFDVPFIEDFFDMRLDHAHIDLRFILRSLGFTGGLKGCEKRLGIDRAELEGLNGYFAVLLWQDYIKRRNTRALETLLAYNIQDVVNLETLMVAAYNMKLKKTPFYPAGRLSPPARPKIPYSADPRTIERILGRYGWHFSA